MGHTMSVHCGKCNHEWRPLLPLPMSLGRAVVVMRGIAAAGCPACHAHGDDVLVGRAAPPTKKRLAMSQADGI